jgi:hypothetical protein
MPPAQVVISGAIAFLAILLFCILLAQWLKAQGTAAVVASAAKAPCGFA